MLKNIMESQSGGGQNISNSNNPHVEASLINLVNTDMSSNINVNSNLLSAQNSTNTFQTLSSNGSLGGQINYNNNI